MESIYHCIELSYHYIATSNMDKDSRPRHQHKRYDDFLNDEGSFTFYDGDHDAALRATFAHTVFIQVFLLFLYCSFLLNNLALVCKEKDTKVWS